MHLFTLHGEACEVRWPVLLRYKMTDGKVIHHHLTRFSKGYPFSRPPLWPTLVRVTPLHLLTLLMKSVYFLTFCKSEFSLYGPVPSLCKMCQYGKIQKGKSAIHSIHQSLPREFRSNLWKKHKSIINLYSLECISMQDTNESENCIGASICIDVWYEYDIDNSLHLVILPTKIHHMYIARSQLKDLDICLSE